MSRKRLFIPLVFALTCAVATPSPADLVGYWPLDGDAVAAVGSDGSLVGTLGATFDRNFIPTGALSFDGSSYVEVPGGGGLDGATLGSISMWVQWIGTQDSACCNSFGNILSRQSNGFFSNNILGLNGDDPTTASLTWQQASSGAPTITGTTPVGSEWAHVAVTFSQFGSELYLNGASQGFSFGPGLNSNATVPLTIGAWGGDGAGFATANIDDVAIFNDYLSADQVLALATGIATPLDVGPGGPGPQPPTPPLPVVQAYASTEFAGRPAVSATNGLGLQPDFSHVTSPPSTMWLTAAGDAAPFIGFDLGSTHNLEDIRIWNYNEAANPTCCLGRGIADATIMIAGEDGQFIPLLLNQSLAISPGTVTDFSETISLGNVPARYVVIQSNGNHGDPTYTGLSEVQFRGEPASGTVLPPTLPASIHAVSSSLGDGDGTSFRRFADNVVNKSGTFANWHSITPDGTMWLNRGSFATPSGLPADLEPEITFDLGSVQKVDRVEIWNYNEILTGREDLLNRGVNEFELLFAGEDLNFTSLGTYQLARAPGAANVDFSEVFDLFGIDARYIKLDIISSHGGDNGFVGLSEVRFYGVVPEPAGAMLWGSLLVFITTRWRRRVA